MILSEVQDNLDRVLGVLQPFLPLVSCHMVDFLCCDLWNKYIPIDIRTEVSSVGADEVYNRIMFFNLDTKKSDSPIQQFLEKVKSVSSLGIISPENFWSTIESFGGKVTQSHPQLSMFMSRKKAHEVQELSTVIACLAQINNTDCVVDLGGGKGYLGAVLAYHYGLSVLSIDSAQTNTHGAVKLADNFKKWWGTKQKDNSGNTQNVEDLYKQATSFVGPDTSLKKFVSDNFQNKADKNIDRLCLVGLHACGDLTPSCLQLFCGNKDIKALCIVGCCYNLITEEEITNTKGFPMSQYLKKKGFKLGRNARMLAAQSVDRIVQENKLPPITLWYRALLQVLLSNRKANTNVRVGRTKIATENFLEYASKALATLEISQGSRNELEQIQMKYGSWQKLLNIFFMMRVALAPVIELIILLDRVVFLLEQGIKHTFLVQLFDSVLSPRCYSIVAFKDVTI